MWKEAKAESDTRPWVSHHHQEKWLRRQLPDDGRDDSRWHGLTQKKSHDTNESVMGFVSDLSKKSVAFLKN